MAARLTLASAAFGVVLGVLASELFRIDQVCVVCAEPSVGQEAAVQAQTLPYGSVWLPPTRSIERAIGGLPRVKGVRLDRNLPRTLVIAVEPREPAAAIDNSGRFMLVDQEGVSLTWTGRPPHYLPLVQTEACSSLSVGSNLPPEEASLLVQVLRGLHATGLSAGAGIALTNPHLISVRTHDGVLGKLGDGEHLEQKTILFGKLLKALREKEEEPLYIDVRVPSHPTYKRAH